MKKVLSFIAVVTLSFLFINNVKAENSEYVTEVDNTNYSIETEVENMILKMYLRGTEAGDYTTYYVYFSNNNNEVPEIPDGPSGCGISLVEDRSDLSKFKLVPGADGKISISHDYYLLKGYQYAYVVKTTYQADEKWHCEITSTPITVEKASLPKLGERYSYFNSTNNKKKYDVSKKFPYDSGSFPIGDHKLTTKIGVINDISLLRKLSKSESGSLEELLNYAKNNEGTSYTYQDDEYYPIDISNINLVEGSYYYVYTTYTDELYRDISDVDLVMVKNGQLDDDITWNLPDEKNETPKQEETKKESKTETKEEIKNPKTGIQKPYIVLIIILAISGISYGILKRKKLFSK